MHVPCLEKALNTGNFSCSICRKSIADMTGFWDELRFNIRFQPMPPMPTMVGDSVSCTFGGMTVESIHGEPGEGDCMYRGVLEDWTLAGGQLVRAAVCAESTTFKSRNMAIYCNDCELSCTAPFHFLVSSIFDDVVEHFSSLNKLFLLNSTFTGFGMQILPWL